MTRPMRIGVVSPFLDKSHGTERCVAEQVERLARVHGCEIVVYSQNLADMSLSSDNQDCSSGRISWRKVWSIPGPHLIRFAWWFVVNHIVRWSDRHTGRFTPDLDLLYSPGINCLDADVVSVHIVFAEFYARVRKDLALLHNPFRSWPRLLHRKLYYQLIMALEGRVYRRKSLVLASVSNKLAKDLQRMYPRTRSVSVIYHGVDVRQFNPEVRKHLHLAARQALELPKSAYVLLLVGNDWKNKGLATLLGAILRLGHPSIWALIVGRDDSAPYRHLLRSQDLERRVLFLPLRSDVEYYYAAADAYVGPSLEDAFALPPLEAMACGIPVIVSRQAGVSELVTHGVDGLILEDARDVNQLALFMEKLISEPECSAQLASNAAGTALNYTWGKNAELLRTIFLEASAARHGSGELNSQSRATRGL